MSNLSPEKASLPKANLTHNGTDNHHYYAEHVSRPLEHGPLVSADQIVSLEIADGYFDPMERREIASMLTSSYRQTYICRKPDDETAENIWQWCLDNNVSSPQPKDRLHVTMFHVGIELPWTFNKVKPIVIEPSDVSVYPANQGGKRMLWLMFNSNALRDRRLTIEKAIKNKSGLSGMFHMNLSNRFDSNVRGLTSITFPIVLNRETS